MPKLTITLCINIACEHSFNISTPWWLRQRERLKCRHQLHIVTSDCPTRPHCIQSPWKLQIIYLYYIFHSFIWWLLIFNFPLMTLSQLLIIDWHRKMLLLWVINIVLYLFQWYICSLPHSPQFVLCVLYSYMLEDWYAPTVHINKLFVSVHCAIIILSDNWWWNMVNSYLTHIHMVSYHRQYNKNDFQND